jgi:hypothetical protein
MGEREYLQYQQYLQRRFHWNPMQRQDYCSQSPYVFLNHTSVVVLLWNIVSPTIFNSPRPIISVAGQEHRSDTLLKDRKFSDQDFKDRAIVILVGRR